MPDPATGRPSKLPAWVPGLPQLAAGRLVPGGAALAVWAAALGVFVLRWDRVSTLRGHGPGDWVAIAVLALCVVVPWWWSAAEAHRARSRGPADGGLGSAFMADRRAAAGLAAVTGIAVLAVLAPILAPFDPALQGDLLTQRLVAPSATHLLGTDHVGRDVLSRLLYGGRSSLLIALLAVTLSVTLGTLLGAVSGYLGRIVDGVLMRLVDVVIAFPRLVLLVTVVAFFERTALLLVLVLGLTQWPTITRIVRAEVLSLRDREFVEAARALGYSRRRIVLRHLLPNVVAPVAVAATLGVGDTIVLEAGLSFLGLGAGVTSWGAMIADGRSAFLGAWWLATFPGIAIVLTVLAVNLVGDGLRNAADPRGGALP